MVPRRPGQFLRERLRRRLAIVFIGTVACVALALLGIRWWPLSLVAIVLILLGSHSGADGRWLDPTNDVKGLEGEERVGELLEALVPDGFLPVHDLDLGFGNVDHVVIGPTGVFAIEV